jgi:hypothetical protein
MGRKSVAGEVAQVLTLTGRRTTAKSWGWA